jgi:small GTP-binding protein
MTETMTEIKSGTNYGSESKMISKSNPSLSPKLKLSPIQTRPTYDYMLKIIIVGESSVGKSNISLRFTEKRFEANHQLTIGVEFGTKIISRNNKIYKLQIWDTAGQEAFRAVTTTFYRGTIGCILVYDTTDKETFEKIQSWYDDLKKSCDPNITIILVGNKSDLESRREVSIDEGKDFADKNNMLFIETSAKSGINVDKCFYDMTDDISQKIENGTIKLIDNKGRISITNVPEKTGWCCY